jgi:hypothetical protein
MKSYQIRRAARNQGLSYREGDQALHFDLAREGRTWLVQLPPTGAQYGRVNLSETDIATVAPRIQKFLSRVWWFGIWPVSYEVVFRGNETFNPSFQRSALGAR